MRDIAGIFALFGGAFAETAAHGKIRVLIVDGCSNHDWRQTTASIRAVIEPTHLFVVDVSTSPPSKDAPGWDAWRPKCSDYDVAMAGAPPRRFSRPDGFSHGNHDVSAGTAVPPDKLSFHRE